MTGVIVLTMVLLTASTGVGANDHPLPPRREHINLKECAEYCMKKYCFEPRPFELLVRCVEPCMTFCKELVATFLRLLRLLDCLDSMGTGHRF